jgi:hypothetical protein
LVYPDPVMRVNEILSALRAPSNKGSLLELALADLLQDLGFKGVRRQQSGSQFGFDVSAYRTSRLDGRQEVWKFECKNLSRPITVEDIAPKLIWHDGRVTIDRFVIVGTSPISNELDFMLRHHTLSMPISVWTDTELAEMIACSPRAMNRLSLSYDAQLVKPKPEFDRLNLYPAAPIALDVVHRHDPPHAFDYVRTDYGVVKAYNSTELRLLVMITNPTDKPFDAYALNAVTLSHQVVDSRVLRLVKAKGLVDPIQILFRPTPMAGSSVSVLGDKVWHVKAGDTEIVELLLDASVQPGLYSVTFTLQGRSDGAPVTRRSPVFVFHVQGPKADALTLKVWGRHYDSPAEQVLYLPRVDWKRLKRETKTPYTDVYLGPSPHEVMHRKPDPTWVIHGVRTKPVEEKHRVRLGHAEASTVLMDLGTLVDEELYSLNEALDRATGTDGWQDLLPVQLKRRRPQP